MTSVDLLARQIERVLAELDNVRQELTLLKDHLRQSDRSQQDRLSSSGMTGCTGAR
jgi:hypothetical protein